MKTLIKFFSILLLTLFMNASVYAQEGSVPIFPNDLELQSWAQESNSYSPMLLDGREVMVWSSVYLKQINDKISAVVFIAYHPATHAKLFGYYHRSIINQDDKKIATYIYKYNAEEKSWALALKFPNSDGMTEDMWGVYDDFLKKEFKLTFPLKR